MQEREIIGRIMTLCEARGWSVYRLAKESGITYSTLCTMLHKSNAPSVYTLTRICDGLGISLSEFFDGESTRALMTREETELLELWQNLSDENRRQVRCFLELLLRDQRHKETE